MADQERDQHVAVKGRSGDIDAASLAHRGSESFVSNLQTSQEFKKVPGAVSAYRDVSQDLGQYDS